MKFYTSLLFVLSFLSLSAQNKLTLEISNVKSDNGTIRIALYNSSKDFLKTEYKSNTVKPKKGTVTSTFNNLPDGEYVIALLHDKNNNGVMDKNFIGLPKEPYSFSRIPKVLLSEPSFKEVSFVVNSNHTEKLSLR